MSGYTPSDDFVQRVMREVRLYEAEKTAQGNWWVSAMENTTARWCLSSGAAALGIWNIVRIYAVLFVPAICR